MKKNISIIYINFAPYENAGKILDYLLANFSTVLLYSFRFHNITDPDHSDLLTVYRNSKPVKQYKLLHTPVASTMTFYVLPLRSFFIMLQVLFYTLYLRSEYGPYDIYFTVNAYTAWIGNILRKIHVVRKTVFWIWDYYPPVHKHIIVRLMRWIYWQFDKPASLDATKVVFLNERLEILRKKLGVLPKNKEYSVVPIGTDPSKPSTARKGKILRFVFFGVVKQSQGLDLIFSQAGEIIKKHKHVELHIIGNGPDKNHYQQIAKTSPYKTTFYGYLKNNKDIQKIIGSCHIGLAPYVPEESNVSYYSDPSKIKAYLSLGVPVITTDVFTFSSEITKSKAGVVIDYFKPEQFVHAVSDITKGLSSFRKASYKLGNKYYYKNIYPQLFTGV